MCLLGMFDWLTGLSVSYVIGQIDDFLFFFYVRYKSNARPINADLLR